MYLPRTLVRGCFELRVGDQALSRQILGEHVAIFRTEAGGGRCVRGPVPSSWLPSFAGNSGGRASWCAVITDSLLDCEGTCVAVPRTGPRSGARERETYRSCKQGLWVWIWMRPKVNRISRSCPPLLGCRTLRDGRRLGVAKIDATFDLLVDNLLDLSHETFLHNGSIGHTEVASTPLTSKLTRK